MRKTCYVLAVLLAIPQWSFAGCASHAESDAFTLRALKSSLMVAALSCNQQKDYNAFMDKNQTFISSGGEKIKEYFKREYGKNAENQMNRFVTQLANRASEGSMAEDSDSYCNKTKKVFAELLKLDQKKLVRFMEKNSYASMHGINSCS